MDEVNDSEYLVQITQSQSYTVSVVAESEQQAIELANAQHGRCECEFPPEIEVEKTRVIE